MQNIEANARPILSPMLSRQDAEIARLEDDSASRKKLMMLVRHNSRSVLTRRNTVDILQDAAAFYPQMMKDMKAARHSIHLQYFIWGVDECTERFKEILTAKAKAGVEVRLLYDPIGSQAHVSRAYVREMEAAGVRMAPTSPFYRLHTISYRNHRKITVIDGAVGYTGGMNIGREHLSGGKGFESWRDTQVRIVGESAAILQAVFMVDWYNAVKEDLFSAAYFPVAAMEPENGDVPVQILTSGPDSQWAAVRQLYFSMIVRAQRHVFLQSPYFILDASIAEALKSAALSGIDVKVMLSARPSGDPVPAWAGNTFVPDVVRPECGSFSTRRVICMRRRSASIPRFARSGQRISTSAASASTTRSMQCFTVERLATELEQDFERDLAYSTEFDVAEYEKRNVAVRFRDSVARLLSPLL